MAAHFHADAVMTSRADSKWVPFRYFASKIREAVEFNVSEKKLTLAVFQFSPVTIANKGPSYLSYHAPHNYRHDAINLISSRCTELREIKSICSALGIPVREQKIHFCLLSLFWKWAVHFFENNKRHRLCFY